MGGVLAYVVTHPVPIVARCLEAPRLLFLAHLLLPLALLPLGALRVAMVAAPSLFLLMISDEVRFYSIMNQGTASILPVLFVATIAAIEGLPDRLRRVSEWCSSRLRSPPGLAGLCGGLTAPHALAALPLCFAIVFHVLLSPSPLSVSGTNVPRLFASLSFDRLATLDRIHDGLPRSASLCATDKIAPHFVTQRDIFVADAYKIERSEAGDLDRADYVLLDTLSASDFRASVRYRDEMLRTHSHGFVLAQSGFLLFRRGAAPWTPNRVAEPERVVARMAFRPESDPCPFIKCLGVDVARIAGTRAHYSIKLLWQCLRPTPADYFPNIVFREKATERRASVGPMWILDGAYPTYLWKPGDCFLDEVLGFLPFEPSPERVGVGVGQTTFQLRR